MSSGKNNSSGKFRIIVSYLFSMTRQLKLVPFLCFLLLIPFSGSSAASAQFEPIVGYERVQKFEPTARTKERLIFGGRGSYGVPLLSAELEVTRGNDTEDFPSRNLTIEETATNVMLGLRSRVYHGSIFRFYLRGGGHARKREIERTENGVTTEREPAVFVSPYAGTGIRMELNNMLELNAGVTAIFTGKPKGSDREYQTTLGFAFRI